MKSQEEEYYTYIKEHFKNIRSQKFLDKEDAENSFKEMTEWLCNNAIYKGLGIFQNRKLELEKYNLKNNCIKLIEIIEKQKNEIKTHSLYDFNSCLSSILDNILSFTNTKNVIIGAINNESITDISIAVDCTGCILANITEEIA
jgi:hypothetical protein